MKIIKSSENLTHKDIVNAAERDFDRSLHFRRIRGVDTKLTTPNARLLALSVLTYAFLCSLVLILSVDIIRVIFFKGGIIGSYSLIVILIVATIVRDLSSEKFVYNCIEYYNDLLSYEELIMIFGSWYKWYKSCKQSNNRQC